MFDIKNKNKMNIIKLVIFMTVLVFLLRNVTYILRTNGDSKDRFAGFYAEDEDTIDVFLMGSSAVAASFSPAYLWGKYGFTSYPLSTNGQRPKAIKYLIDEGLRYQKPVLIVVEMRTFIIDDEEQSLDEGHIREVTDNLKYSSHRIDVIDALVDKKDERYSYYFDLFKYHYNVGHLKDISNWAKFTYKHKDPNKGFVMRTNTEEYRTETPDLYTEKRVPIPHNQEEILEDLLLYLSDNDLPAIFVVTPRDNDATDYDAKMNYCSDIITGRGYDFINLNFMYDEMGFDYKYDIHDGAHTNVWGAIKCCDVLGQYITDKGYINRLHDKKTVEEWDEAYRYFEEELARIVQEK